MHRSRPVLVALLVLAACASDAPPEAADERPPRPSTTSTTAAPATTEAPTTTTPTTAAPEDVFALQPPPLAATPEALAELLVEAETAIADPTSDEGDLARAGLAQQRGYRQLGIRADWEPAVLAALPETLRPIAVRNAAARREFRGMHTKPSDTLPAWRIVRPDPADELLEHYRAAEAEFGIPWRYLAAIHLVETGLGRIRGTSIAGAQGPMQFLPSTWAAYGGGADINDTGDAIRGAARYLASNNGAVDIDHALFRYNHSQRYVRGVRLYADLIAEHPRAFLGYYHWGIWYLTDQGDVYLPVGYAQEQRIPVADYRAP